MLLGVFYKLSGTGTRRVKIDFRPTICGFRNDSAIIYVASCFCLTRLYESIINYCVNVFCLKINYTLRATQEGGQLWNPSFGVPSTGLIPRNLSSKLQVFTEESNNNSVRNRLGRSGCRLVMPLLLYGMRKLSYNNIYIYIYI